MLGFSFDGSKLNLELLLAKALTNKFGRLSIFKVTCLAVGRKAWQVVRSKMILAAMMSSTPVRYSSTASYSLPITPSAFGDHVRTVHVDSSQPGRTVLTDW